jgi:C-terminal processing protease CtpA/Prc
MFRFIEKHEVEALVIDIRENPGGNGALNRALIHGLIRCDKLQDTGRVFVLIGRRTFSAALSFALDLEQNTNAVFVGEPTGAKPNNFGESKKITLPGSGLTVRTSTLYHQLSDPRDHRDSILPHIPVPLTSEALRRDVAFDKVVEIVRAMRKPAALTGRWEGTATFDFQRVPITIENGEMTAKDIGKLKFEARAGDGWMFGTIRSNGLRFPFLSRRALDR